LERVLLQTIGPLMISVAGRAGRRWQFSIVDQLFDPDQTIPLYNAVTAHGFRLHEAHAGQKFLERSVCLVGIQHESFALSMDDTRHYVYSTPALLRRKDVETNIDPGRDCQPGYEVLKR
jgi:hypothetical protein